MQSILVGVQLQLQACNFTNMNSFSDIVQWNLSTESAEQQCCRTATLFSKNVTQENVMLRKRRAEFDSSYATFSSSDVLFFLFVVVVVAVVF